MTRRARSLSMLTIATLAVAAPASAQGPTISPGASPLPGLEARVELAEDLPTQLGGFEPVIEVTHGPEHFADLDLDDAADRATAEGLQGLLSATSAEVEDLTSGYALASVEDFFAFVVAVRVAGAEEEALLPAYLPILLGGLIEPTTSQTTVAGKPVTVITTEGEAGEPAMLYVYSTGETVWIVQGPEDVVAATIADLP